jgi:hypothetical protein
MSRDGGTRAGDNFGWWGIGQVKSRHVCVCVYVWRVRVHEHERERERERERWWDQSW